MKDIEIKVENIMNPPEKMRLMFEAVSQLVREQQNLERLKVQDITAKAGIGKGTAYEYFTSKEEIIANALMYEYSNKIQSLVESVFAKQAFKDRIYQVMDWIDENKEYNQMFSHLMKVFAGPTEGMTSLESTKQQDTDCPQFGQQAFAYILQIVDKLMEEGYQEGVFTETNAEKRAMAVLTAMCEYGTVVMSPFGDKLKTMNREGFREFIYDSVVKVLKE